MVDEKDVTSTIWKVSLLKASLQFDKLLRHDAPIRSALIVHHFPFHSDSHSAAVLFACLLVCLLSLALQAEDGRGFFLDNRHSLLEQESCMA